MVFSACFWAGLRGGARPSAGTAGRRLGAVASFEAMPVLTPDSTAAAKHVV